MSRLAAHDWPGNVRELQNLVERALILSEGGPLHFYIEPSAGREMQAPPSETLPAQRPMRREELKRQERDNIIRALQLTKGKVFGSNGAAQLLGMKPTTLASRIAALGLKRTKTAV